MSVVTFVVISANTADQSSLDDAQIAADLGARPTDLSIVPAGPRIKDTLDRLVADAARAIPVFWHSLRDKGSRQYAVADIVYATTAFGQCMIVCAPEHRLILEAAEIAARIIGGSVEVSAPGRLSVFNASSEPALASAPPRLSMHELLTRAADALASERGFSFIRLNHCEPRIMGVGDLFTLRDSYATTGKQWGRKDTTLSELAEVSRQIRAAVRGADVLGIPIFRNVAAGTERMLERSVYFLAAEPGFLPEQAEYADVNVHNHLSVQPQMFAVMKSARRLMLISCRDCFELDGALDRNDLVRVRVPPPLQGNDSGHYPKRYNEIVASIANLVSPGTLVLVGAGVLGKIYCNVIKQAGGVALDIGSLLDTWEGLKTRTSFKPEMALKHQLAARVAD